MVDSYPVAAGPSWKAVLISLVDSLRWPVAAVAVAIIFREPLGKLIAALAGAIGP